MASKFGEWLSKRWNDPLATDPAGPYWSNRLYSNLGKLFQVNAANQEHLADIQARKDVNADIQQVRQQLGSATDPEQKQQLQDKLDKLISQRQELENKRYAAQANFYNALGNIASSAWDKGMAHDKSSAYYNERDRQHQTEAAEYQRAQQANMQIANRDTRQEAERTAASEDAFKAQQAAAHLSADAGSGAAALAAAKAATDVTPDYARYEQRSDERRDTALDNAQSRYTAQQYGIQERALAAAEDYQSQQTDRYNNQVQALSAGNSPYVVPADTITNNKEETSNSNPGTEVITEQPNTQPDNQNTVVIENQNEQTQTTTEPEKLSENSSAVVANDMKQEQLGKPVGDDKRSRELLDTALNNMPLGAHAPSSNQIIEYLKNNNAISSTDESNLKAYLTSDVINAAYMNHRKQVVNQ